MARSSKNWYFQARDNTWSSEMSGNITDHEPRTLGVPEAGRKYFGLGRNASYAAAKRGDIPTIRMGRLLRAPIVALERRLEEADQIAAQKRHDSDVGPTRKRSARGSP
jgi:hypothetical protein